MISGPWNPGFQNSKSAWNWLVLSIWGICITLYIAFGLLTSAEMILSFNPIWLWKYIMYGGHYGLLVFDREWNLRSLQSLFDDNHYMVKSALNCPISSKPSALAIYLPNTCQIRAKYLPNTCQILAKYLSNTCQILTKYLLVLVKSLPNTCRTLAKCLPTNC